MPIGNNIGGSGGGGGEQSFPYVKPFSNTAIENYTLPKIDYSPDYIKQDFVFIKLTANSFVVNILPGNGQIFKTGDPSKFEIVQQSKGYRIIAISETEWIVL